VKRRIARWLFGFAPPAQRRRYGDDFDVLIDDLAGADELHWRQLLNIALVGGSHRLRQLRGVRRAGLVVTALLLAGTVSFVSLHSFDSSPPRPSADGRISTTSLSVEEPATETGTTASCPSPVVLRSAATISEARGANAVSIVIAKRTKVVSIGPGYNLAATCYFEIELTGRNPGVLAVASAPRFQPLTQQAWRTQTSRAWRGNHGS
jgi:hypothetical protein